MRRVLQEFGLITLIQYDPDPFPDLPNLGGSPVSPGSLSAFVSSCRQILSLSKGEPNPHELL
jgi:hypothetical protein